MEQNTRDRSAQVFRPARVARRCRYQNFGVQLRAWRADNLDVDVYDDKPAAARPAATGATQRQRVYINRMENNTRGK